MANHCPYCNALTTPGSQVCGVCGERLAAGAGTSPSVPVPGPVPRATARPVVPVILSVMVLSAALGLGYALWTQSLRRANDHGAEIRPPRSPFDTPVGTGPAPAVAPEQLAALRYLPAGLDLLVGVHFAGLYDEPATRTLLEQPLALGPTTLRLADLREWTGLEPAVIDHAVLGLGLPPGGLPRVVLVVRTRREIPSAAVRTTLQAREVFDQGLKEKKQLWNVRLGKLDLPAVLWQADERTLVLGLSPADLADLPVADPEKLTHLPENLRGLLRQRLDPGVSLWSVGRLREGLRGLAGVATAGALERWKLSPQQRQALEGLQTFAGGIVAGEEVVCRLSLELENTTGAAQVADLLRGPDEKQNLRIVRDGAWILLQWKTTREQLAAALPR